MNNFLEKFIKWGPGKELELNGKAAEVEDKGGDPLHEWHQGGEQESLSLTEDGDGLILSEGEFEALELENKDWIDAQNITEDGHFTNYEGRRNVWTEEDPEDGREYLEWRDGQFEQLIESLEDTEVPFEEQDILGDTLRKNISNKKQVVSETSRLKQQEFINKKIINELPMYSTEDFKLMKEAALFNSLIQYRPRFADKSPMTDEQIIENVAQLLEFEAKRDGDKTFSPREMKLMEQCKIWYDAASRKEDYREMPKRADGKPFSQQEINELALEYSDLRKNDPLEFAKLELDEFGTLKVEKGDWKKTDFRFTETDHKGGKTWVCDKKEIHDGNIINVRYVSELDPSLVVKPGDLGSFFYTTRKEIINPNNKNLKMEFINLKLPIIADRSKSARQEFSHTENSQAKAAA